MVQFLISPVIFLYGQIAETPSIPTLFLTMGEGHVFQCTIHKHALKLHPILFQADILFVLKNIHDVLEQKIKLSSSQIELT